MIHKELFPIDIPPVTNEATKVWEQFGLEGQKATQTLISMHQQPYLRGSRLLRMLMDPSRQRKFDEVRSLVRYRQRTVPSIHAPRIAADPDTNRPIDNQIELKIPIPIADFAEVAETLRHSLSYEEHTPKINVPCYLHPKASSLLRESYNVLQPRQRIRWDEGSIPGRDMPYAGIRLESDWVGAGSTHITPMVHTYWRVYPKGEQNDMRLPKHCTSVDGLWGKIISSSRGLEVELPSIPTSVTFPDSAIQMHDQMLRTAHPLSAMNVSDIIARGLRNGNALGIRFHPEHLKIASRWMHRANEVAEHHPVPPAMKRNIAISLLAAELHDSEYTKQFLSEVNYSLII